jgi:phospholipid N-methyltransferase
VPTSTRLFLQEFIRSFHTTGAALPSGKALAKALASPLEELPGPRNILEAGPGTGAITGAILERLQPGDRLTLCEFNPSFVAHLNEKFERDVAWKPYRNQVKVVQADVREILEPESFQLVVSGLPLNNFEGEFVEQVAQGFIRSLVPGGVHTFFEYLFIRPLRMKVDTSKTRTRLRAVEDAVQKIRLATDSQRVPIYGNFPPAWAYRLCKSHKTLD